MASQIINLQLHQKKWLHAQPVNPHQSRNQITWPKISIVTPSYNQGQYIEETILSILNQNYPNLEYIIIDGDSTDQTVEIIKTYENKIKFWVSEPDKGQVDAINKGLKYCTGEIFNWINSDDLLAEDSLFNIAKTYLYNNAIKVIAGGCTHFSIAQNENQTTLVRDLTFSGLISEKSNFQQPSQWLILKNIDRLEIRSHLHYSFDWGMYLNLNLKREEIKYLNINLSYFREHEDAKTSKASLLFKYEKIEIVKDYRADSISLLKKILLSKYIYNLSRYLKIKSHLNDNDRPTFKNFILFGFKSPTLFLNRFYLGHLKNYLIEEKDKN